MNNIEINISRLNYLLGLFNLTKEELLSLISQGLKNPIKESDVFEGNIKLSHLKKIDNIFKKGLQFYVDPEVPIELPEASVFFRKQKFNSELNLGARKIVNAFEEEKISLSALAKLSDLKIDRKLPVFKLKDNPKEVSIYIRDRVYPTFNRNLKEFLKAFIGNLAEFNILVFEFVETWNKKEKANIDGFYLSPNAIILKRQQKSFRREIFTLAHELGHFLLEEEEIESISYQEIYTDSVNSLERWCNDFAYFFLIGDLDKEIKKIISASSENDYFNDLIENIKNKTHLSKLALYTRLLLEKRISPKDYNIIREEEEDLARKKVNEENRRKEQDKALGIKREGRSPKPIKSPLFIKTIQAAFIEGVINETEFCKKLNIKPKQLAAYQL